MKQTIFFIFLFLFCTSYTSTLSKFNSIPTCFKCGAKTKNCKRILIKQSKDCSVTPCATIPEHYDCKCAFCGYTWMEAP